MPSVIFNIDNGFATITRLVVDSVMKQLMYTTGITGAEIIINEPLGHGRNQAATSNKDAPALRLESGDYLFVTYNERFDEQAMDPLAHHEEHNYVFLHSKAGIRLRPITCKTNIEFNLIYRSKSYSSLAKWLSRFQRNKVVREPHNYHDILYNYTLPESVVAYLYDVYHLQQAVEPYGTQTLKEFYQKHYTKGLISRSNISGNKHSLAVNTVSKGNLGYFTSLPEEISSDKEKLIHEINFNYTLSYDKVIELLLEYQIFIHNQRIDNVYLDFFVKKRHPVINHNGNRTFTGFVNTVTEKSDWYKVTEDAIFFDPVDHFLPKRATPLTSTMLMVPIQINPLDLRLIEDLNVIPDVNLPLIVKQLIIDNYESATEQYKGPFLLELFAVDNEERPIPLTMDNLGIIRSTIDLNLRKRHYLRVSILTDLRRLPMSKLKWLAKNPSMILQILNMINPFADYSTLGYIGGGTVIEMRSLTNLLESTAFANNGRWVATSGNLRGSPMEPISRFPAPLPINTNSMGFSILPIGYFIQSHIQTVDVTVMRNR